MRLIYLHFTTVLPAREICGPDEVETLLSPSHRIKEVVTEDSLEAYGQLAWHTSQWTGTSASNEVKTNTPVVLWSPLMCTMTCVYPSTPTHMHTYYASCRHTLEKEREFTLAEVCYRAKCESALEFFLHASIYIPKNSQHFGGYLKLETRPPISWASILAVQGVYV